MSTDKLEKKIDMNRASLGSRGTVITRVTGFQTTKRYN